MNIKQLAHNIVEGEYTQNNDSLRMLALEVLKLNEEIESLNNLIEDLNEELEEWYEEDIDYYLEECDCDCPTCSSCEDNE